MLFEKAVSDSVERFEAFRAMAGCFQHVGTQDTSLDDENFNTLFSKCVSHSNRLLKKPAAANCFIVCANLYVATKFTDARVAAKCLMKVCKRASQMMQADDTICVFLAVLNKYIFCASNRCSRMATRSCRARRRCSTWTPTPETTRSTTQTWPSSQSASNRCSLSGRRR